MVELAVILPQCLFLAWTWPNESPACDAGELDSYIRISLLFLFSSFQCSLFRVSIKTGRWTGGRSGAHVECPGQGAMGGRSFVFCFCFQPTSSQ